MSITILLFFAVSLLFSKEIMAVNQDVQISQTDMVAEQYLIPLLNALKNRDRAAVYELWVIKVELDEEDKYLETMFDLWNGREIASVEKLDKKKRIAEGKTPGGITYRYEVMSGNESLEVKFTVADDSKKLDWFHITATPQITGTLDTWREFNLAQWLMAALATAEIIFSFYVAVICIKERPKLWGLWLAFILTIYSGMAFSTKGDIIIRFFLSTFAFPKILNIQNLEMQVSLSIPIGAVIYLMRHRRKLDLTDIEINK